MTSKNSTETTRETALNLLRRGLATPSEAAELAQVDRQLVRYWLQAAGIDWRKARQAELAKRWRRATRNKND